MKKAMMLFLTLVIILGGLGVVSAAEGDLNTNCQLDHNGNLNEDDDNECDEENNDLEDNEEDENECDEEDEKEDNCCGTAIVGDRVWNDSNANGIQDACEQGIAGVTVNLWSDDNNAPGSIVKNTTTNVTGYYLFTNVVPGKYWLQFIVPDALGEWIFTLQNQGADDTLDSDANATGIAGPICLVCGQCDTGWDAGLYQYATLGDRVWTDSNKNGIQDAGEQGVAGVTVNLWSDDNNAPGSIVNTTTTNATGYYLFTNVVPGKYWLQFVLPSGISSWIFTLQNQGADDALDSDANATGIAGPIILLSGAVDLTWDAGLDPGDAAGGDEEDEDEDGAAGGDEEVIEIIEIIPEVVAAAGEEVPLQETGVPILPGVLAALMIGGGLLGRKLRK
jgi:hypothetical protein